MSSEMNEEADLIQIRTGDIAPNFTLPTQDGKTVSLKDFRGQKAVVLYFYPKDETVGCTAEACSFRDSYQDFTDAGAEVIGVSSDSAESHAQFATHHNLPFILASDEDGAVRKEYGVPQMQGSIGIIPGRVTYVIDKNGIVKNVFSSMKDTQGHINESLNALKGE
jgi:thioredoxin-dependent peroxiredoxin